MPKPNVEVVGRVGGNKKNEQMSMQGITEGLQYIVTHPVLIIFSLQLSLINVTCVLNKL